jgi:hypothetical protein
MKIFNKVRGSAEVIPNVEVNKDTVYIRSNILAVNEDNFKGWEYDEVQYEIKEYIGSLAVTQDTQAMAMIISDLMAEIDTLKSRLDKLEVK